jgi:LysM repeat protein
MARRKVGSRREKQVSGKPSLSSARLPPATQPGGRLAMRPEWTSDPVAQLNLLGDTRFTLAYRRQAAVHIGQTHGNHRLQRMIAQLKADPLLAGSKDNLTQRQDEQMVEKGGGTYQVVAGDSLWKIARNTYGSGRHWRDIYRANSNKVSRGGNLILVGTILVLPILRVSGPAAESVTEEASGGTDPAAEPYGLSSEFGSFEIYPDEFVGPLPVSVRDAESWPIKQADYDLLTVRLTAVKKGSSKVTVEGGDQFMTGVYLDLAWLMTSAVGQDLVKELQEAKHSVKIVETTGGNSEEADVFEHGLETTDVPPKPGPGTNVTVKYNPNRLFIKDGTLDWHHRPPAIALAHEMIHAWTDVYGMSGRGKDASNVPRYELQAVGLGEFRKARISENRFRAAFGLPLRPVY